MIKIMKRFTEKNIISVRWFNFKNKSNYESFVDIILNKLKNLIFFLIINLQFVLFLHYIQTM